MSFTAPAPLKVATITVWVCPTPDCGNYFASPNSENLDQEYNRRTSMQNRWDEDPEEWRKKTSTRAECPDCRIKGLKVERIKRRVTTTLPLAPCPAPPNVAQLGEVQAVEEPADAPVSTGEVCGACGGSPQRTGSCMTCPDCGTNTGCS